MGRYRITRTIVAPPAAVFRTFTEPGLVADWMAASGVRDQSAPLDTSGAGFTLVIQGPWRFRSQVVRSEPPRIHETAGRGPLGASYRMVATLEPVDGGTRLDLLTEYTAPLGPIGRWMDRRWLEPGPRAQANREVDRLVELATRAT